MKILQIIGGIAVLGLVFLAGYWFGVSGSPLGQTGNEVSNTTSEQTSTEAPEGSVEIDISSLTDSQRSLLKVMGVDGDSVTLTPAMIECAEAAVGAERLSEIKAGATPSFTEGSKLLKCYNSF